MIPNHVPAQHRRQGFAQMHGIPPWLLAFESLTSSDTFLLKKCLCPPIPPRFWHGMRHVIGLPYRGSAIFDTSSTSFLDGLAERKIEPISCVNCQHSDHSCSFQEPLASAAMLALVPKIQAFVRTWSCQVPQQGPPTFQLSIPPVKPICKRLVQ